MNPSINRITVAALCLSLITPALLAEEAKKVEDAPAVTGTPPADSPFAKIKPGMPFKEALQVLGKPTSERAYCTGKHHIPFYFARDRALTEYYYQGQGVVVFYTDVSVGGWSRYKSCSPSEPLEISEVHYNAAETGVAPKEGEERPAPSLRPSINLPKPYQLAINGYGRIGRCFLRALLESPAAHDLQVVAINEPANLDSITYLTRYDSTHGRFPGRVESTQDGLLINGQPLRVSHARTPEEVDWSGIDLVVECSGAYGRRAELGRFLAAGAPRLLLSHPGASADDVDATIIAGINQHCLQGSERLVSAASCTTNAIVPILDLLDREIGIEQVLLSTLHSVMNDQPLIDGYHHDDLRRTRSAMQSIIPVSTGLARGVERLLPQLAGRVTAKAIRVPTTNVSAIDLTLTTRRPVSAAGINTLLAAAANGPLRPLLAYSEQAHASIDFNHDPHSAIIDGSQTRTGGEHLLNLFVWFDNEWGFANRMLDVADHWSRHWTDLS